jgi:hypothetical protein
MDQITQVASPRLAFLAAATRMICKWDVNCSILACATVEILPTDRQGALQAPAGAVMWRGALPAISPVRCPRRPGCLGA